MKCETCNRCLALKENDSVYDIACRENGNFTLHRDFEGSFNCNTYQKAEPKPAPPKENVLIVLSGSGRDFVVYDEGIKNRQDIRRRINEAWSSDTWTELCVTFGDLTFYLDDIAVYGYIGD